MQITIMTKAKSQRFLPEYQLAVIQIEPRGIVVSLLSKSSQTDSDVEKSVRWVIVHHWQVHIWHEPRDQSKLHRSPAPLSPCEETWWLCYAVRDILLSWFGFTFPLKGIKIQTLSRTSGYKTTPAVSAHITSIWANMIAIEHTTSNCWQGRTIYACTRRHCSVMPTLY